MLSTAGDMQRQDADKEIEPMSERLTLPVLPLREVVLFPGVSAPIGAGRPATLRAIEAALKSESHLIFAVAQRENVDTVTPGVLYTTGTIAKISQIQRGLGGVQLLLHGENRATALHYSENGRYLEAIVRELEDLPPLNPADRPSSGCIVKPGGAPPSWARNRGFPKMWSGRCSRAWPTPGGWQTSSPVTSRSRRRSARGCSKRCPWKTGCGASWSMCSARSGCWTRRSRSSRRCRRSWASASGRCSCESS